MADFKTLDNKVLKLYNADPYIRIFIYGPRGGYYGSCLIDIKNIKDIKALLQEHLQLWMEAKGD